MVMTKPIRAKSFAEPGSLQDLIAHSEWAPANTSLGEIVEQFRRGTAAFIAVCEQDRVIGVASRESIEALCAADALSLFASQPVSSRMEPEFLAVRRAENILNVLTAA